MKRATFCLGVSLLALASTVSAQILTGTIIGTVRDDSGAVLPGVTVTLLAPTLREGGVTVVTNEQGQYRFAELVPGPYSLTVTMTGFGTYKEEDLIVAVGGTTERSVKLQLGSIEETIVVSGESPMIDPRKVGVTANLDTRSLETLPRNRNAIYELMKWTPGVAPPDPSGGSGGSVMGASTGENSNLLDGVMTNHPSSGGGWSSGDVDAMEEVQVLTLGASAEYQVAQGGVFNVVMKQGTNSWKGDASAYWYPDSLLSKPVKRPCNCDLDGGETGHINLVFRNYSAHVGGPIRKDRLWFFGGGNYDRRKQGLPGTDPRLIPKLWYSDAVFGKATWRVTDNIRFTGMYHQDIYGSQNRPSASRPFETINASDAPWLISYAPEVNWTLSSRTLLTARVTGWTDRVKSFPYTGDKTASYHIDAATGQACCGVQSFGNTSLGRHGQAVKLNHNIQGGWASHDIRFGVQLEEAHAYGFNAYPSGVQYSDLNGQPDQASFRNPYVSGAEYTSQGVWVEDQLNFGGRLTISLGLRYDRMHAKSPDLPAIDGQLEETGETIQGLGDMFTWKVAAPRVGFNYKLTESGKTIVRGHYGRAYRTIFLGDFDIVYPGLSPITLARYDPATGRYSTLISVTDSLANTAVDPDLETPFTDSYSVGTDHELFANLAVSFTYAYKHGQNVVGWQDTGGVYGTRTDTLPDGQTVTVLPLLNAPRERKFVRTNGPGGFTRYHGAILALNKRLSRRWTANISYTYSKAEGLITSGTTGQDPNDNINATGLLATDRPHMVLAAGTYQIPKIDADISFTYLGVSGTPFAPQALIQLPQGRRSVNIASPDGTYRVPAQKLLSLRFTKILFRKSNRQVELGVAGDNLLQSLGYNSLVTQNFYSTSFAAGDNFIEGRRMNFVARVKF